ncbi:MULTISPECIES: hypothetical protein [Actinomadura]|uniref:Uncharacterized protein n=1 Tax=Actinomadura yumaensis TaxID=111807 RepID=A0ABW2CUJ4_9ACTN|nr:hypothetical protein [Actinomadura sp. J1-007]
MSSDGNGHDARINGQTANDDEAARDGADLPRVRTERGVGARATGAEVTGASATGFTLRLGNAFGSLALGSMALGAIAIGAVGIGKLVVKKAIVDHLEAGTVEIKHLKVGRLDITDS